MMYLDGRAPTFVKKLTDTSAPLSELSSSGRYRIVTRPNESKSTLIFNEAWDSDNNSKISCEIVDLHGRDTCEAVFH
ncbi:unnamed protein product, partial [Adineta steineri]